MSEQQKPTGSRLYSDKVLASQGVPVVQTAGAVDKSSSPCWRGGELHMDVGGGQDPRRPLQQARGELHPLCCGRVALQTLGTQARQRTQLLTAEAGSSGA